MAFSTGTIPLNSIHSSVVETTQEKGINIYKNEPKLLATEMLQYVNIVIDRNWKTPKCKPIEEVRQIRDETETKVVKIIPNLKI